MKHLYSWLLFAAFLFFFSCTQDPAGSDVPTSPEKNGHRIPVESALAELNTVLTEIDGQTRTGGVRTVGSITSVSGADIVPATRSGEVPDLDDVVYIANFANNEGYAILAADDRLRSVIAVTEQGSLTPEEFVSVAHTGYNTSDTPPVIPEVVAYAAQIGTTDIGGPIINPPLPTTLVKYGDWYYYSQKGPYILIKWDQTPPYNYYSPEMSGMDGNMNGRGYVGCVAVAVGQLIAMNSYRGLFLLPYTIGDYTIDKSAVWRSIDILKNRARGDQSFSSIDLSQESLAVAYFLRAIGNGIGMNYKTTGSGAPSENAAALLSSIGYRNVSLVSYSENQVSQMLNNRCPVYIEGKGYNGQKKEYIYHAWLIDGLYRQRRQVERWSITTGELLNFTWEYRNLFHCNFGWRGRYDGYYIPEIYDIEIGAEFVDPVIDGNKNTTNYVYVFNRDYKIITHAYSL